jgi:hypothetical protein
MIQLNITFDEGSATADGAFRKTQEIPGTMSGTSFGAAFGALSSIISIELAPNSFQGV